MRKHSHSPSYQEERTCLQCGEGFSAWYYNQKFCCLEHGKAYWAARHYLRENIIKAGLAWLDAKDGLALFQADQKLKTALQTWQGRFASKRKNAA